MDPDVVMEHLRSAAFELDRLTLCCNYVTRSLPFLATLRDLSVFSTCQNHGKDRIQPTRWRRLFPFHLAQPSTAQPRNVSLYGGAQRSYCLCGLSFLSGLRRLLDISSALRLSSRVERPNSEIFEPVNFSLNVQLHALPCPPPAQCLHDWPEDPGRPTAHAKHAVGGWVTQFRDHRLILTRYWYSVRLLRMSERGDPPAPLLHECVLKFPHSSDCIRRFQSQIWAQAAEDHKKCRLFSTVQAATIFT
ncbi:uncharacterized protein LACBIDRAFT_329334 [Laccaria bicolor S238N-H82]|uniref:Predicted protein n=1 Tax=Laccaria bicolor (strain S238N-H82 / ATCC MYA-4686) TaxID=486041 RepID=B0DHQ0_LACBS|nr:uncharacterized protein LACBIDRAFT_329334 [Laccaria bicolor S238N-H82]EDR05765.1 predicted protein [Laccaria bicolor S238N-H82]|eukprot:XP_001883441.1 predicted protein [Laccaria bicolor S238N-H82]